MPSTRLFIGGLNIKVDKEALDSKLSHYGTVLNVDLKEKKDVDGNITVKFAYVNIEAASSQLRECVQDLNGASWLGSRVRVEPAKESFLDRLKRERASQLHQQKGPGDFQSSRGQAVQSSKTVDNVDSESPKTITDLSHDEKRSKKKKKAKHDTEPSQVEDQDIEENSISVKKKKKRSREKTSTAETETSTVPAPKAMKKNKVEQEILSSFKTFSSVWGDSDTEDDKGSSDRETPRHKKPLPPMDTATRNMPDRVLSNGNRDGTIYGEVAPAQDCDKNKDKQKWLDIQAKLYDSSTYKSLPSSDSSTANHITRYDPTLATHHHFKKKPTTEKEEVLEADAKGNYVQLSKTLKFGQESSSGFSLLAQFSQQQHDSKDSSEEEKESAPVLVQFKPVMPRERNFEIKTRPFFISSDDQIIEDAITWMVQSVTGEVRKEFEEVQPELRDLYKIRASKAMKELNNCRIRGRGRGRGMGRGRGKDRSRDSQVNFSRDENWERERITQF